jgi:transcription antitermination protein NusB
MTRRSRGREVALQVLYQIEQNPGMAVGEVRQFIDRRLLADPKLVEFTLDLIAGVRQHQPRIDEMIKEVAENWRLDRMAAIDRNILRLGAYEMLFRTEVPAKVAINEALELAKRYSTAQSSRFVNGILDRVLQLHATPPAEDTSASPSPCEGEGQTTDDSAGIPDSGEPPPLEPGPAADR